MFFAKFGTKAREIELLTAALAAVRRRNDEYLMTIESLKDQIVVLEYEKGKALHENNNLKVALRRIEGTFAHYAIELDKFKCKVNEHKQQLVQKNKLYT